MKAPKITPKTTILADVTINADRKYSQSYGAPIDTYYAFAKVSGNWIEIYHETGAYLYKFMISAKHFNTYNGTEITERTFLMRTKKAKAVQDAKRAEAKAAEIAKQETYKLMCADILLKLPARCAEVKERVSAVITIEQIDAFKSGDKSLNELCNRAVGIVGYDYAKHLSWHTVLREIRNSLL
jgi:hypothetical protein